MAPEINLIIHLSDRYPHPTGRLPSEAFVWEDKGFLQMQPLLLWSGIAVHQITCSIHHYLAAFFVSINKLMINNVEEFGYISQKKFIFIYSLFSGLHVCSSFAIYSVFSSIVSTEYKYLFSYVVNVDSLHGAGCALFSLCCVVECCCHLRCSRNVCLYENNTLGTGCRATLVHFIIISYTFDLMRLFLLQRYSYIFILVN